MEINIKLRPVLNYLATVGIRGSAKNKKRFSFVDGIKTSCSQAIDFGFENDNINVYFEGIRFILLPTGV